MTGKKTNAIRNRIEKKILKVWFRVDLGRNLGTKNSGQSGTTPGIFTKPWRNSLPDRPGNQSVGWCLGLNEGSGLPFKGLPLGHPHQRIIIVQSFKLAYARERLPHVITSSPSNIEFDRPVNKAVADDLVNKPLVIVWHPKIVEVLAFPTGENPIVIRLKRSK